MSAIWSDEEKEVLLGCNSRQEAKQKYRDRFPDSPRAPATIARRFYDMRPDKREPIWSDREKAPILAAETVEEAISEYRKLFPKSTRSDAAVRREWWELRPEKRGLIPCGRKKGGRNKVPLPGTAREKYGIPMSTKQDAKAYNHAVYICTKFDKPYVESLELEKSGYLRKQLKRAAELKENPPVTKVRVVKPSRKPAAPRPVRKTIPTPVRPPAVLCIRCHTPISPMDFLYTEKTGLCISCWEAQEGIA